jgi:formate-dependent nitrite reductase membrane component NrfD
MDRAPYGRRAVEVLGSVPAEQRPPTYYNRPGLKSSDWRWLIVTYFFVGGLAGAAQVIAGVLDLLDQPRDRPLVSTARYMAVVGALISPVCLIADLKTPSRWYTMVRIFRPTSPMNIGSWTLLAFGGLSGLAAVFQFAVDVFGIQSARALARLAGIPAAASGMLLATYTGSLLAATSTPLWAAGYRLLPAIFGLSGTSAATALLSLLLPRAHASRTTIDRIERLALVAAVGEFILMIRQNAEWKRRQVSSPLEEPRLRLAYQGGAMGLGLVVPIVVHLVQWLSGRELRVASSVASVAALAGSYLERTVMIFAGSRSAENPVDYFRLAQ